VAVVQVETASHAVSTSDHTWGDGGLSCIRYGRRVILVLAHLTPGPGRVAVDVYVRQLHPPVRAAGSFPGPCRRLAGRGPAIQWSGLQGHDRLRPPWPFGPCSGRRLPARLRYWQPPRIRGGARGLYFDHVDTFSA